jgi:hypothetical protein
VPSSVLVLVFVLGFSIATDSAGCWVVLYFGSCWIELLYWIGLNWIELDCVESIALEYVAAGLKLRVGSGVRRHDTKRRPRRLQRRHIEETVTDAEIRHDTTRYNNTTTQHDDDSCCLARRACGPRRLGRWEVPRPAGCSGAAVQEGGREVVC